MAIYSFYIFDRHCECIYVRQWHERAPSFRISSPPQIGITSPEVSAADGSKRSSAGAASPASGVGPKDKPVDATTGGPAAANASKKTEGGLSVQDDAKLVFGVVFSLRNMVRKLSGPDDAFISYRTGTYKLHYYETPTNLRFVMLTDVKTNNLRVVLHQIYVNLYVEYVTKNPLSQHHGGEGVAVELFEMGLDSFIRTIQD